MTGADAIEAATLIGMAGMSVVAFLRSRDTTERIAMVAVAGNVMERRASLDAKRRNALALEISSRVGNRVGAVMGELVRAFTG